MWCLLGPWLDIQPNLFFLWNRLTTELMKPFCLKSERRALTVMLICVTGGEGAGSPWAELVHAAPHTGLLGGGWPGPAAGPGETLRDDSEEEENAPTQQEEEMRWKRAETLVIRLTFWTTTCLRTLSADTSVILLELWWLKRKGAPVRQVGCLKANYSPEVCAKC